MTIHTARRVRIALAQHRRRVANPTVMDRAMDLLLPSRPAAVALYGYSRHQYANTLRANPLFVYDGVTYRRAVKSLPAGDPLRAHPNPDAALRKMMLGDETPHVSPMMLRAEREGIR